MQYNTAGQPKSRPTRDYAPKKHKNKKLANLPLLLLFVALLALMYVLFPKEAGRHVGHSQYEGLVISEVMSANNSAVPDENGNFPDWLEIYNGTDHDIDMEGLEMSMYDMRRLLSVDRDLWLQECSDARAYYEKIGKVPPELYEELDALEMRLNRGYKVKHE